MFELYAIKKEQYINYHPKCKNQNIEVIKFNSEIFGSSLKNNLVILIWKIITFGKAKAYVVRDNQGKMIHYSCVIPRCIKFPFMDKNDIEIGPCFTDDDYRGQGIYPYVLSCILANELREQATAYMLIKSTNTASINGVKKVGFTSTAEIRKDKFGRHIIINKYNDEKVVNGIGWKYYNHAVIPITAPHNKPNLSPIQNGEIWKIKKGALLARWTEDFDCDYETEWWYCIKDTPFDISKLKAKRRYEIIKGKKNFIVKVVDPVEYCEEIIETQKAAFSAYPVKYRPVVDEDKLRKEIYKWQDKRIFGAFEIETGRLRGYSSLKEYEDYVNFAVLKTNPKFEKLQINAALVSGICEYYNDKLSKDFYICDGERNTLHETAFQGYLEKYFGFRKAYCNLKIKYKPSIHIIVKILYPFKNILIKFNQISMLHKINAILEMETIRKDCEKNIK